MKVIGNRGWQINLKQQQEGRNLVRARKVLQLGKAAFAARKRVDNW